MTHDDDNALSASALAAIRDGEAAWLRVADGNWDQSGWRVMGTALTLLRAQVLHTLGINKARGGGYNDAFRERLSGTAFATMEPVTRSNLLFLMEPENRVVLDRLLASWTPEIRARRTHPITLAQYVKREQKPPAAAPGKSEKPAAGPAAELIEARKEIEMLRQQLAALDWQARGDATTAQRGAWSYLIRRDVGRRFIVAISSGRSLPEKLVEMPSLEQAKAHCAEHAAAHPVSDAAELARLRARVAELEAKPPKPVKPPLDPESAAAQQIKGLVTKNQHLRRRIARLGELLNRKALTLPRQLSNAIDFALHPDQRRNVTAEHLDTAYKHWNAWRDDLDKAGRVETAD